MKVTKKKFQKTFLSDLCPLPESGEAAQCVVLKGDFEAYIFIHFTPSPRQEKKKRNQDYLFEMIHCPLFCANHYEILTNNFHS